MAGRMTYAGVNITFFNIQPYPDSNPGQNVDNIFFYPYASTCPLLTTGITVALHTSLLGGYLCRTPIDTLKRLIADNMSEEGLYSILKATGIV